MRKTLTVIFVTFPLFFLFAKGVSAICSNCTYSTDCTACVNCEKTCTTTRECDQETCYSETTSVVDCDSGGMTCESCDCTAHKCCTSLCTGEDLGCDFSCAKPAWCYAIPTNPPTPAPTATPIPTVVPANFCVDTCGDCNPPNPNPNYYLLNCWGSETEYNAGEPPSSYSCVYNLNCSVGDCHILWETCGGTQVCLPPLTSHIDSCGDESCGAQCDTAPTCTLCSPGSYSYARSVPFLGSVVFGWLPCGSGIVSQDVYVDDSLTDVQGGCSGTTCVFTATGLGPTVTQQTVTGLADGTVYHYDVIERNADCTRNTIAQSISSCRISPATATIGAGQQLQLTSNALDSSYIDAVTFSSSDTVVATVSPASDSNGADGYSTVVTALSGGTATITANVVIGGVTDCTATAVIAVADDPWWQVIDADVTAGGDLSSTIPATCTGACSPYFDLVGLGGYPGVPFSASSSYGSGDPSVVGWDAQGAYAGSRIFNYDYFYNKLPDETSGKVFEVPNTTFANITGPIWTSYVNFVRSLYQYGGYYLLHSNYDLTFNTAINAGTSKYILFVNGNVTINYPITVTDGSGLFMIIATGNINFGDIAVSNPNIEGLYVANGSIVVGSSVNQFNGRGSFVGNTGISLGRDLADNSLTPAEVFTYAPDQVMLMPSWFYNKRIRWKEVAP